MPRRYRGRDIWFWLGQIGNLDEQIDEQADPAAAASAPSLVVSGVNSSSMLDLGVLGDHGVTVAGRLTAPTAASRLPRRPRRLGVSDRAMRGYSTGSTPPSTRALRHTCRGRSRFRRWAARAAAGLDLAEAGISTIVWATGYGRSYDWLHLPALGADGEIVQRRGVTPVPGLYVVGLRFQYRRKSHFIGGVGEDAQFLAERIVASDPYAAPCKLRRLLALAGSERARSMTKPGTWCPYRPATA